MTEQGAVLVRVSWRRIERWLAVHAPADREQLNPPATHEEIEAAEHVLGLPLPAELAQSLACHNGFREWTGFFMGESPLPVHEIAETRQSLMELAAEVDGFETREWDEEPWWHPQWLPWAMTSHGVYNVIDLRPGPGSGRLGWAGHSGGGDFGGAAAYAWPNLPAALHAVAQALNHGVSAHGEYPYLTADGRLWWDKAGARELNGSPLRPAPIGAD